MIKHLNRTIISIFLCLLTIQTGCNLQELPGVIASVTPSPTAASTHTNTPVPPRNTPTLILVPPSPTISPVPTFAREIAEDRIIELVRDNAECKLPCWWGFIPGETNFAKVETFLSPFKQLISHEDSQDHGRIIVLDVLKDSLRIPQYYAEANGMIDLIWVALSILIEDLDSFDRNNIQYPNIYQTYGISEILSTYGLPEEVMILAANNVPEKEAVGRAPFSIILKYLDKGILVEYHGIREKTGDNLRLCPKNSGVSLWLWQPHAPEKINDYLENRAISPLDLSIFLDLTEAAGMDIQTFYQKFTEPDSNFCIETPANLWP